MSPELSDVKRREEEKRDAVLGPAERWRLIMEAITWAGPSRRCGGNTPARCRELERAQLAGLAASGLRQRNGLPA